MFKYMWIVALVLLFEFSDLLPFKKHFNLGIDSIFAIVTLGNGVGAVVGFLVSPFINFFVVSFCEFFAIDWDTIARTISTIGTILGAFIGFIYMIIEEWEE